MHLRQSIRNELIALHLPLTLLSFRRNSGRDAAFEGVPFNFTSLHRYEVGRSPAGLGRESPLQKAVRVGA